MYFCYLQYFTINKTKFVLHIRIEMKCFLGSRDVDSLQCLNATVYVLWTALNVTHWNHISIVVVSLSSSTKKIMWLLRLKQIFAIEPLINLVLNALLDYKRHQCQHQMTNLIRSIFGMIDCRIHAICACKMLALGFLVWMLLKVASIVLSQKRNGN